MPFLFDSKVWKLKSKRLYLCTDFLNTSFRIPMSKVLLWENFYNLSWVELLLASASTRKLKNYIHIGDLLLEGCLFCCLHNLSIVDSCNRKITYNIISLGVCSLIPSKFGYTQTKTLYFRQNSFSCGKMVKFCFCELSIFQEIFRRLIRL